jgi:predicted Rossmann fold flavoprotein
MIYDCLVIGGGAAGFFAALAAKSQNPNAKVAILEKSAVLLSKVRVSGGGRCNVTHACLDPLLLSKHYPRGEKELVGPFHRFQPKDTIAWFEERGVRLKTEEDGRMFPVTDSSETIIDCLLSEAKKLGVEIHLRQRVEGIEKTEQGFLLKGKTQYLCNRLIVATGSSAEGHAWASALGHTIQPPVPSLFTFNVPNSPLQELSGIAFEQATVQIRGTSFTQAGPLLITHFGFSGPAVLKLSAWAARELHAKAYDFEIAINWLPQFTQEQIATQLHAIKKSSPQKTLLAENPFHLPKNFWKVFCTPERMNDISLKELNDLAQKLHCDLYAVKGKTTHKEEFVTCGGVSLKEVHFKTMESKVCPGLHFAGEVLDIDGITGGFNFQNAWTTGFLAGSHH